MPAFPFEETLFLCGEKILRHPLFGDTLMADIDHISLYRLHHDRLVPKIVTFQELDLSYAERQV